MEKIVSQTPPDSRYHSKEIVSSACSEIFENILRKTYEEENPFKSEWDTLMDKLSIGSSIGSSDFTIIPKGSISPNANESKTHFEAESSKSAMSRYTAVSDVTQVGFLTQKVSNPFEKLLTANESFTYRKPYYPQLSQNTIIEEEEADCDYNVLDGMSVSTENIRSTSTTNDNQPPLRTQNNVGSGIINSLLAGKFEQEVSIPNNLLMRNPQREDGATMTSLNGQGDSNPMLPVDDHTSISIKINFAFYAKLLAILLTINTIVFFKTFVFTNIFLPLFD